MKKILMFGKLNRAMQESSAFLSDTFQVQMCPEQLSIMKTLYDIMEPDLIIVNQVGLQKEDIEVMDWIAANDNEIPVIVVTTPDREKHAEKLSMAGNDVYLMKYPAIPNVLRGTCINMIQSESEFWAKEEVEEEEEEVQKTVMIVDDNPVTLRNMKGLLEEQYDVMIATSGSQALNFIYKKKPDLLLLDYEMPEMNGLEVYSQLKCNAKTKDIPVVFLTGVTDKESVMKIIQSEPRGYIVKPPVKEALLQKVKEVLG